jgi:phosphatidylglycerol:prolipoprotein diacylglycerol transferase
MFGGSLLPLCPLATWTHDLSPFALQFSETFGIRWYGLAYIAAFAIAYQLFARWTKAGWLPLHRERVGDFLVEAGVLGTLVGGRVGYCLIYATTEWLHDPLMVFRVWEGGMASHGGIVGIFLGAWWFARRHHLPLLRLLDALSLAATPGIFLGRMANFINGELWGRTTDVAWGIIFPNSPQPWTPRHPSQIYEALLEGLLLGVIGWLVKRKIPMRGAVFAIICTAYPALRIVGECFREPDPQIGWLAAGLTMGQWLSIGMLLASMGVWWAVILAQKNDASASSSP